MARQAIARREGARAALRDGRTPWTNVTGPRGYASRIDGSVQPYVLSVPGGYEPEAEGKSGRRVPAGRVGARAGRNADRVAVRRDGRLPARAALPQPAAGVEGQVRPQPLRPVPHGVQVRRRNRRAGGDRGGPAVVPDRPGPDADHRLLDGRGDGVGVRRRTTPTCGPPPVPGAGFAETPEFLKSFQKEDVVGGAVVPAGAVALVRLPRLRGQPVEPADDRVRRRAGPAEAGVGRDAEGSRGRGGEDRPDRRPADRSPLHARREAGVGPPAGRDPRPRPRPAAAPPSASRPGRSATTGWTG